MKSDLKGKRIGIIGPIGPIGIGKNLLMAACLPPLPQIVDAINAHHEREMDEAREATRNPWPTTKPTCDTSAEINFVIHAVDPMPEVRIDKTKDKFSFLDFKYGRGKGKAKSQGYAQHFKR